MELLTSKCVSIWNRFFKTDLNKAIEPNFSLFKTVSNLHFIKNVLPELKTSENYKFC